jgi:hypothetical protein
LYAYHLKVDEFNTDVIQTLKNAFYQREIVILTKETCYNNSLTNNLTLLPLYI